MNKHYNETQCLSVGAISLTYEDLLGQLKAFSKFVDKEHIVDFITLLDAFRSVNPSTTTTDHPFTQSEFMDLNGVCRFFNLPLGNVKNRQWREKNGFPAGNDKWGGKLSFSIESVRTWMAQRNIN